MDPIVLNKCIDKETKYYGLKLFGLISGGTVGGITCILFNLTIALGACVLGYLFGAYISGLWHTGELQRSIYWNLPSCLFKIFLRHDGSSKFLPSSHNRNYM